MNEEVNKPGRADQTGDAKGGFPRGDKDAMAAMGEGRFRSKRRRKVSFLTTNKVDKVDYKDIATLRRFLNERGKILASRQTGNTAGQQRMISDAIHKAREMALLPFTVTEMSAERSYGPRRERYDRGDRGDRYDRGDRPERSERPPRTETPAAAVPVSEAPAAE